MKREWDRNRYFVIIRFRRPTSAQLSRAVKADEISVVEPTQPLRLARQSKENWEARTFVPASYLWCAGDRFSKFSSFLGITKITCRQVIVYRLQRKLQIFNGDSRLPSRLVFTKASVFDTKVEVIFFLQFLKDVPISLFIKMVATVENFKTHSLVFQEGIGSFKAIL